jgi:hypothetical protein
VQRSTSTPGAESPQVLGDGSGLVKGRELEGPEHDQGCEWLQRRVVIGEEGVWVREWRTMFPTTETSCACASRRRNRLNQHSLNNKSIYLEAYQA